MSAQPPIDTARHGVWSSVTGPEDGPALVLVHGSMDRSTGLSRLARRFDGDHRVLRLDRRGYGRSSEHPGPFAVADHVDDLVEVIAERLDGRPLHLFGVASAAALARASEKSFLGVETGAPVVVAPTVAQMARHVVVGCVLLAAVLAVVLRSSSSLARTLLSVRKQKTQ